MFRIVIEEALKNPKGVYVRDLLETIKKEYGYDVSRAELYEVLLRLEVRGYITVYKTGRDLMVKPSRFINKLLS